MGRRKIGLDGTHAYTKEYDKPSFERYGALHDVQLRFLETNVMKGEKRIVDVSVSDPSIKVWNVNSTKELYKNN